MSKPNRGIDGAANRSEGAIDSPVAEAVGPAGGPFSDPVHGSLHLGHAASSVLNFPVDAFRHGQVLRTLLSYSRHSFLDLRIFETSFFDSYRSWL